MKSLCVNLCIGLFITTSCSHGMYQATHLSNKKPVILENDCEKPVLLLLQSFTKKENSTAHADFYELTATHSGNRYLYQQIPCKQQIFIPVTDDKIMYLIGIFSEQGSLLNQYRPLQLNNEQHYVIERKQEKYHIKQRH